MSIDLAVIGAGPAGVAAAVTAARAGARVTLIDENGLPGGQYFKQPAVNITDNPPPLPAENLRQGHDLLADLSHPNITFLSHTLVWNLTPDRTLSLFGPDGPQTRTARQVIIATGAHERVMPFPGWTLPGVMTVGGAQLLLKGQRLLAGHRILLAGTGPLLTVAGAQLLQAGAEIAAVLELQPLGAMAAAARHVWGHWGKIRQAIDSMQQLRRAGVPVKFGHAVIRALGDDGVSGAVMARVDAAGRPRPGTETRLDVDTILLNVGFAPDTRLSQLAGCDHRFAPELGGWAATTNEAMETSQPGIFAAGEVRGIGGVDAALPEGQLAGLAAARALGHPTHTPTGPILRAARHARAPVARLNLLFSPPPGLTALAADDTPVCRCEEIPAAEILAAARAGIVTLNNLKPWTRAGMGRCQGRVCGEILAHLLADETGQSLAAAGQFTARPPVKPVPLSAFLQPSDEVAHGN